jgi:hypothetical protein
VTRAAGVALAFVALCSFGCTELHSNDTPRADGGASGQGLEDSGPGSGGRGGSAGNAGSIGPVPRPDSGTDASTPGADASPSDAGAVDADAAVDAGSPDTGTPAEICDNTLDDDGDGDSDCSDADCADDPACVPPAPAWHPHERIGHDDVADQVSNFNAKVAVALNGDAYVTFYDDGNIWARRFVAATRTFDTLVQLSDAGSRGVNPLIAVDDAGNALVAWYGSATNQPVYARMFTASLGWPGGWGTLDTVQAGAGTSTTQTLLGLAMTKTGHACLTWQLRNYTNTPEVNETYLRVWESGHGWDVVRKASGSTTTSSSGHCGIAQIGQDLRVVVAWSQSDATLNVLGAIYDYSLSSHTGTLGAPAALETESTLNVLLPQVAVDAAGNAVVAMIQRDQFGQMGTVLVNRYTGVWSGASPLNATIGASSFDLDVHPEGDAWVVWRQCSPCAIWGRRLTGASWESAVKISADDDFANSPAVAIDASGNALAAWTSRAVGVDSVFGSEFTPAGAWTPGHLLEDEVDVPQGTTLDLAFEHDVGIAAWVRDGNSGGNLRRKIFGALYW